MRDFLEIALKFGVGVRDRDLVSVGH